MIFVCGGAHSGTTLMATILGAHSQTYLIPDETNQYLGLSWITDDRMKKMIAGVDSEYIVEKTPKHVFHIDKIKEDYPDGRFIVMFRNPLDVSASIFKRDQDWQKAFDETINDLNGCIKAYNNHDVLLVSYENLVTDFANQVSRVCDYVGLEYQDSMKDFHMTAPQWFGVEPRESEGVGEDHVYRRAWQVRQPLYDGRGRWKNELNNVEMNQVIRYCMHKYEFLNGRT